MFLRRGVRSFIASSFNYYNFAGSVQVARSIPQDAIGTLHNSRIISCSQLRDRAVNSVCVLRLPSGMLQDNSVKNNIRVPHACTACKSVSRLDFILPFSWRSKDRNTNDRLNSPKSLFCICTETCIVLSSTDKPLSSTLSNASKQKQENWMKRESAPDVQKVLLSKSPQEEVEEPEPGEKQNKTKELKKIFKEYGAVGVSFHIGISLISLGIFYIAVSSGINMTAVLCKMGFTESVVQSKMAAGTSTFVLAYAVHKLFAPFRISITLVSVPLIVRYLRKTGLFKSSPPRL
ncbi:protein FAM210B, mitochondrial isoform X3 [Neoarius graeffei]|uniref:protein FAM210B, mitochondrial isoform X3 n=1 Tax=Neoarius graeffei TaxID=443677 RepID=UPI00298BDBC6|nr:protein FAM210B, mitochondrial isoform X3 [Neoarius graeffei]